MAKRQGRRDIDELGQDDFKAWCTDNGLIGSPPKQDRLGWDFFVEVQPEMDSDPPFDRRGPLLDALVQVKATEKFPSRSVQVKLSALKHLVDKLHPAFLAFLEYRSGEREPARARLLHIGPTQIEQVLRKVRQTEKKGRGLHEVKMRPSFDEAAKIDPDGGNLREIIQAVCPNGLAAYVTTKDDRRNSCGYDRNSVRVRLFPAEGVGQDAMVDLALGYVPDLPFREMTITRTRFGIPLDQDVTVLGTGRMSMKVKPLRRGRIAVVGSNPNRRPSLDIEVFTPGIPGARRVRLKNEFLDVELHFGNGTGKVYFEIDRGKPLPVERLAAALAFAVGMSEPGAGLEIEPYGTLPIRVPSDFQSYRSWRPLHEFVDTVAVALFRHRGGVETKVSLREMSEALKKNLDMFCALTRPGVELTWRNQEQHSGQLPAEQVIYMPICICLTDLAYQAIVKINGKTALEDNSSLHIVGDKPSIVEDTIIELSKLNVEALNERAAEIGRADSTQNRMVITTMIGYGDQS